MTEPTPEQMERLREIAREATTYISNYSIEFYSRISAYKPNAQRHIEHALLTVWREAQGENVKQLELLKWGHQQYAFWSNRYGELTPEQLKNECISRAICREEDMRKCAQLEASLRLAVTKIEMFPCQCAELERLKVESGQCFRCTTLSIIRANHPQLMEGEK